MTVAEYDLRHPTQDSPGPPTVLVIQNGVETREEVGIADVPEAIKRARRRKGFVWVQLANPDEALVTQAQQTLGIHPLAAADVVSGRQQPKVQQFADHLFVLLWQIIVERGSSDIVLGQTFLYMGDGWLVTVQRVDEGELEDQVCTASTTEDHKRIYRVRKDIGRIDRAVSSIAAALRQSTDHLDAMTVGHEHVVPYLHDLLDDAAGTAALINDQSRTLDAILSSHESNVAARQNKDMRTIPAFATLLALPTLIAGLYGMNFKNIPFVQWQYGWVVIAAGIVTVDIVIYIMFKRRHWL